MLKKRVMRRTDQAILGVDVSHGADSEAVAGATEAFGEEIEEAAKAVNQYAIDALIDG